MARPSFRVAIVGAGVAGALLAHRLGIAKRRVALIDAGGRPFGPSVRASMVERFALSDKKLPGSPYDAVGHIRGPEGKENPQDEATNKAFDLIDGSAPFKSGYEMIVGGSTWHWLGSTPRLIPSDFRMHSECGVGVDWPISYEHLEPWYGEAEHELGVAGDHAAWDGVHGAHRSRPYPMSEIWPSHSDLVVERALRGFVYEDRPVTVMRTPQARNSRPFDGRPACAGNSSCVPICPIAAKYDATVHVEKALALPGSPVVLFPDSLVLAREPNVDRTVRTLRVRDLTKDVTFDVDADIVVIAAHGIESARLMLASGLAKRSGQVGRNLMDHLSRFGSISANEPMFPFRGPPTTSGIDAFRNGSFRAKHAAFRLSLGNDGAGRNSRPEAVVIEAIKSGLLGERLRQSVRSRFERLFRLSASTEVLPRDSNRVERSQGTDAFGRANLRLNFGLDDYTVAGFRHAERVMKVIFERIGHDGEPRFEADPLSYSGAGHIMGTARMGNDPTTSVVNADCRAHDHPNLYVIGSSVFPTSGTANPTLTAAALALRLARHLLDTTHPIEVTG